MKREQYRERETTGEATRWLFFLIFRALLPFALSERCSSDLSIRFTCSMRSDNKKTSFPSARCRVSPYSTISRDSDRRGSFEFIPHFLRLVTLATILISILESVNTLNSRHPWDALNRAFSRGVACPSNSLGMFRISSGKGFPMRSRGVFFSFVPQFSRFLRASFYHILMPDN